MSAAFKGLRNILHRHRGLDLAVVTDRGLVRPENQDTVYVSPDRTLFGVADGMGGGACGELASQWLGAALADIPENPTDLASRRLAVERAIGAAHGRIVAFARERGFDQMGTTLALLLFDAGGTGRVALAHIGDSRVYRRRGTKLEAMTADHRLSRFSHVITRVVGCGPEPRADWTFDQALPGDIWLVCSDGVHDMLEDSTINGIFAHGGNAAEMANRMAAAIRRAGARDNFSFVLLRYKPA